MTKPAKQRIVRNNNPYLAHGAVATAFSAVFAVISLLLGISYLLASEGYLVKYEIIGGLLNITAGVLLCLSFALGVVALASNRSFSIWSAGLSLIAMILTTCSLGVAGFDGYAIYWTELIVFSAITIAFDIILFILFAIYYSKAPIKTVFYNFIIKRNKDIALTLSRIEGLFGLYNDGILTEEEYAEQKRRLLTVDTLKPRQAHCSDGRASFSVRKIVALILMPLFVAIGVSGGALAGMRMSCYENIYSEIVCEMGNLSSYSEWSFRENKSVTPMQYLLYDVLPYDYKDTVKIKEDYKKISELISSKNSFTFMSYRDADDVRDAYKEVYLSKDVMDSRWNMTEILAIDIIYLYDGRWSCGDYYLNFSRNNGGFQSLDTNLPYADNESILGGFDYMISWNDYNSFSIVFDYNYYSFEMFNISDLVYDAETDALSIRVFCIYNDTYYTMTLEN